MGDGEGNDGGGSIYDGVDANKRLGGNSDRVSTPSRGHLELCLSLHLGLPMVGPRGKGKGTK